MTTLWYVRVCDTFVYIFSSFNYKHIPDATRKKLDDRIKVMLLISYQSTCTYKLYYPLTNKVKVNKDVIVKESETWDWSKSPSNSSEMTTLEYDCASKGDSASKEDSSSKGDSAFEGDTDSEGWYESEGESDS